MTSLSAGLATFLSPLPRLEDLSDCFEHAVSDGEVDEGIIGGGGDFRDGQIKCTTVEITHEQKRKEGDREHMMEEQKQEEEDHEQKLKDEDGEQKLRVEEREQKLRVEEREQKLRVEEREQKLRVVEREQKLEGEWAHKLALEEVERIQGGGLFPNEAEPKAKRSKRTHEDDGGSAVIREAGAQEKKGDGTKGKGYKRTDTLFFPSVPIEVEEEELRIILEKRGVSGVEHLRLKEKNTEGFAFVWMKFSSAEYAAFALKRLKGLEVRTNRRLAPVFHQQAIKEAKPKKICGEKPFKEKVKRVLGLGGAADTLLIRKIPAEVHDEDIETTVRGITDGVVRLRYSDSTALPTSLFSGGDLEDERMRKCWVTYEDREACEAAFGKLSGRNLSFGKHGVKARLHVALHDDTTDAHNPINKGRNVEPQSDPLASPCVFFRKGTCTKGESCRFQHVEDVSAPKTPERCKFFFSGRCSRVDQCPYRHDDSSFQDLQALIAQAKQRMIDNHEV